MDPYRDKNHIIGNVNFPPVAFEKWSLPEQRCAGGDDDKEELEVPKPDKEQEARIDEFVLKVLGYTKTQKQHGGVEEREEEYKNAFNAMEANGPGYDLFQRSDIRPDHQLGPDKKKGVETDEREQQTIRGFEVSTRQERKTTSL